MKHEIGDVVRLKSKEDLLRLGTWREEIADVCGGGKYKISGFSFTGDRYISGPVMFDEESIDYSIEDHNEYSLNELKREVDRFRDYILEVSSKNNCCISLNFEWEDTSDTSFSKTEHIKTSIKIF